MNIGFLNTFGLQMQQSQYILRDFEELFPYIQQKGIKRIIELGTGIAGYTVLWGIFAYLKNKDMVTYDIQDCIVDPKILTLLEYLSVRRFIGDVSTDCREKVIQEISDCPVLLICDLDISTKKGFTLFAEYLKSGDIVIIHNYYDVKIDLEAYDHFCSWPFIEVVWEDIEEIITKYGLRKIPCSQQLEVSGWLGLEKI